MINWRTYCCCLIVCLIAVSSRAQTVLISDEINVRPEEPYQLMGKVGDRVLFFHDRPNQTSIQVYDENLRYIRSAELTFEKRRVVPFSLNVRNDTINYVYYFKQKGQVVMMTRQYNASIELIQADTIFVSERTEFSPRYSMIESEDYRRILIYSIDKNTTINARCYDFSTQEVIWEDGIETSGQLRENFETALVSKTGDAYFVLNTSPRSFRKNKTSFKIIRYTAANNKAVEYKVEIDDLKSGRLQVVLDNKNNALVFCGLYGDKPNGRRNGAFVLRIDQMNPQNQHFQKIAFDRSLESEIMAEERDRQEGIMHLEPVDIVLREDGGILLVNEIQKKLQRYGGISDRGRNPGARNWTDYYHEDLIMLAFHPDGTKHWHLVLHKKQYSQDDNGEYSSIFLFRNRSAVRLFFNDEISTNSTVSEYIIAGDGRAQRKSVMSTEYQRLRMRFAEAVQLDGRSFIVPSDNGSKMNLVKVAY